MTCYQTETVAVNVVLKESGSFVLEKADDGQWEMETRNGKGAKWKPHFLIEYVHLLL